MSLLPVIVSRYKTFLRFFGLVHIGFAIFIFFDPGRWLDIVNLVPNQIHMLRAIDAATGQYWVVCSAAYAWAVGILFLFAAHNALNSSWGFAIIIAKLGGSIGFGWLFYKGERYFAYALTPLIDLAFILMIFGYLVRTSIAQRRIESINALASSSESSATSDFSFDKDPSFRNLAQEFGDEQTRTQTPPGIKKNDPTE